MFQLSAHCLWSISGIHWWPAGTSLIDCQSETLHKKSTLGWPSSPVSKTSYAYLHVSYEWLRFLPRGNRCEKFTKLTNVFGCVKMGWLEFLQYRCVLRLHVCVLRVFSRARSIDSLPLPCSYAFSCVFSAGLCLWQAKHFCFFTTFLFLGVVFCLTVLLLLLALCNMFFLSHVCVVRVLEGY